MKGFFLTSASLLGLTAASGGAVAAPSTSIAFPTIETIGPPQIVFNWKTQRCSDGFVPDAPARAFRTGSGQTRLFATSAQNWALVGPSLASLRPDCVQALAQSARSKISDFEDLGWIEATYAVSQTNVAALVSNEWSGYRHRLEGGKLPEGCDEARHDACIYYSITEAISTDGGKTFQYKYDDRLVAASAEKLDPQLDGQRAVGAATVSNVIRRGNEYYVFVGVRGRTPKESGACLLRTEAVLEPNSWRAWNGSSFSVHMAGAYGTSSRHAEECERVDIPFDGPVELRSVEYAPALGEYVGVFQGAEGLGEARRSAIFFTLSTDLLHWTSAQPIMATPKIGDCRELLVYPSLLDPSSSDQNFGTVSVKPFLYMTRLNRTSCQGTLDRDLIRFPLRITR